MTQTPPGWYPEESNPEVARWWDGQRWTNERRRSVSDPEGARRRRRIFWLSILAVPVLAAAIIVPIAIAHHTTNHCDATCQRVERENTVYLAYPPQSSADLATVAGSGDASALQLVRTVNRPFGNCQRPSWYATVPPGIHGRKLAADELAFFAAHSSFDLGSCSAFLYVFHSSSEATRPGYTAGAVIDTDGQVEVHTGDMTSAPAFIVKL